MRLSSSRTIPRTSERTTWGSLSASSVPSNVIAPREPGRPSRARDADVDLRRSVRSHRRVERRQDAEVGPCRRDRGRGPGRRRRDPPNRRARAGCRPPSTAPRSVRSRPSAMVSRDGVLLLDGHPLDRHRGLVERPALPRTPAGVSASISTSRVTDNRPSTPVRVSPSTNGARAACVIPVSRALHEAPAASRAGCVRVEERQGQPRCRVDAAVLPRAGQARDVDGRAVERRIDAEARDRRKIAPGQRAVRDRQRDVGAGPSARRGPVDVHRAWRRASAGTPGNAAASVTRSAASACSVAVHPLTGRCGEPACRAQFTAAERTRTSSAPNASPAHRRRAGAASATGTPLTSAVRCWTLIAAARLAASRQVSRDERVQAERPVDGAFARAGQERKRRQVETVQDGHGAVGVRADRMEGAAEVRAQLWHQRGEHAPCRRRA